MVAGSPSRRLPNKTRLVAELLDEAYGQLSWRRHLPPVDELVATILSQHTSDTNTDRAFASLRRRFPTWHDVIAAPTAEVAGAIRTGGLANQKAPRIQAVLRSILERYGAFDLDCLADASVRDARAALTALHGVGPKTASCVLLFSLGMPAMPVDTHVHRVAGRLGLIGPTVSAEAAHELLEAQLEGDRDQTYALHVHLIQHGRAVCQARRPLCDRCALIGICDYVQSHQDHIS
jgi:endonuclease-3